MTDLDHLVQDKYDGDVRLVTEEDKTRLAAGEPLAYVIGWLPFLGLRIDLSSRPLIPRPETEWWTEQLIARLTERFANEPFSILDLCAGSGAIGLSILKAFSNVQTTFGELMPEHCAQIQKNIELNNLDTARADIRPSDLFKTFGDQRFNLIVCNPPYIPSARTLDSGVTSYEPHEALFSGEDGLDLIRTILHDAPSHFLPGGELWLECDISNIEEARQLALSAGAKNTAILTDLYDRPRVLVAYYP